MQLSKEFIEDCEMLNLFELNGTQQGLKVHHDASPERLGAAKRLFKRNLTTLEDGGYLTSLGVQAAEHVSALITILGD